MFILFIIVVVIRNSAIYEQLESVDEKHLNIGVVFGDMIDMIEITTVEKKTKNVPEYKIRWMRGYTVSIFPSHRQHIPWHIDCQFLARYNGYGSGKK